MKEIAFNLLEEPWIRVLRPDCRVEEVSLRQALLQAQAYSDLAGELPTQDVAVLRLLLAVLHGVFGRVNAQGQPVEINNISSAVRQWRSLWELGRFPEQPIVDYLEQWHDRFWLFHPKRPFWQVPEAEIGTKYTSAKLNGELSESGNKLRLFPAYAGTGKTELTYAQAARWLLYINGFDDTSSKPKGTGLPSVGAGWLGKLGLIQAVGNNLFETLLMNLMLLQDASKAWGEEKPCWELDHPRSGERIEISQPDNPAALLTLQSRRLLLHRNGDRVIGYALLGGDFFEKTNAFCEQMTIWRTTQEKKDAPFIYLPKRHDPSRQFWREFPTIFTERSSADTPIHTPGIVRWMTLLQNPTQHCLSSKTLVRFRVTGVEYGDKDFFVTDTFQDELSFHISLLDEIGRAWRNIIKGEIHRCEQFADALGKLARDLAQAAGAGEKDVSQSAKEQFYFRIDQPFRQWLYSIDPDWDEEETDASLAAWREQSRKIAYALGHQLVEEAGPTAFVGRMMKEKIGKKEVEYRCAAPIASNKFAYRISIIEKKG
ncbi:MAG: type I-E CRISPR-associated protein Cse1/CasA [Oscillospiraceae bacterium]